MVGADFAVAVQHDIAVARESRAAVVQQHRILAVADDADFRHVGDGVVVASVALGLHLRVLVTFILCHLEVDIGFHLCLLFQQGLHGTHGGFMHEVALQAVVGQIVGQAGQNHALVVGIMGLYGHMVFFVVALEETEAAECTLNPMRLRVHAQCFEPLQVFVDALVVDSDGHQRAVGRQHDAVGCGVLELEVWHTEGVVLVILSIVELVVGGLRDTPWQLFLASFHLV